MTMADTSPPVPASARPARQRSPLLRIAGDFSRSWIAMLGLVGLLCVVLIAIFAPLLAPQNPYDLGQIDILDNMLPPGEQSFAGTTYLLGTDQQGRDLLSAILYGLRISLLVGVSSAVFAVLIGATLGLLAAYIGGRFETFIMRLVDLQLSFPSILVALMILAFIGRGVGNVILALIIVEWATYARTARGSALSEIKKEYIEAAEALSIPVWRMVFRHLLPNCTATAAGDRHGTDRPGDHAGGDALLPRPRRAGDRTQPGDADLQWLPVHDVRQAMGQPLPRHRPALHHRLHQPRRRPPA